MDLHKDTLYSLLWHIESLVGRSKLRNWLTEYISRKFTDTPPIPSDVNGDPLLQSCVICTSSHLTNLNSRSDTKQNKMSKARSSKSQHRCTKKINSKTSSNSIYQSSVIPRFSNVTAQNTRQVHSKSQVRTKGNNIVPKSTNIIPKQSDTNKISARSLFIMDKERYASQATSNSSDWLKLLEIHAKRNIRDLSSLNIHIRIRYESIFTLKSTLNKCIALNLFNALAINDEIVTSMNKLIPLITLQLASIDTKLIKILIELIQIITVNFSEFIGSDNTRVLISTLLEIMHHPNLFSLSQSFADIINHIVHRLDISSGLSSIIHHIHTVIYPLLQSEEPVTTKKIMFINKEQVRQYCKLFRKYVFILLIRTVNQTCVKVRYKYKKNTSLDTIYLPWDFTLDPGVETELPPSHAMSLSLLKEGLALHHNAHTSDIMLYSIDERLLNCKVESESPQLAYNKHADTNIPYTFNESFYQLGITNAVPSSALENATQFQRNWLIHMVENFNICQKKLGSGISRSNTVSTQKYGLDRNTLGSLFIWIYKIFWFTGTNELTYDLEDNHVGHHIFVLLYLIFPVQMAKIYHTLPNITKIKLTEKLHTHNNMLTGYRNEVQCQKLNLIITIPSLIHSIKNYTENDFSALNIEKLEKSQHSYILIMHLKLNML